MNTHADNTVLRREARASDAGAIERIVTSSGYFSPAEVGVAVELVQERLARGEASGYHFLFAEQGGSVVGYACFGPIACSTHSFDLYWIAVDASSRGSGLGRLLLEHAEEAILRMGGRRVYIETSGRPLYEPTRGFYARCGYAQEARLEDFYGPGDAKVIYVKVLEPRNEMRAS